MLFVGTIGLVTWSYLNRIQSIREFQTQAEKLASNVSRLAKGFDYTESRDGKPVFKVIAGRSLEFREGSHVLEDVELYKYDRQGHVTDFVKSGKAIYDPQQKHVAFSLQVELKLSNGITVHAGEMNADVATEQLEIPGGYVFESGKFSGRGSRLSYNMKARRIEMSGGAELGAREQGKSGQEARADQAVLLMQENRIDLAGGVRVTQAGSVLTAESMRLGFNFETRQIQQVDASGVVATISAAGSSRTLTAEALNVPVKDGRALSFQASGQRTPARLEFDEPGARRRLEGSAISAALDPQGNFTALDSLRNVRLAELPQGVQVAADRAHSTFANGKISASTFTGRVALEEPAGGFQITSDALDIGFDAEGAVSRFDAQGTARAVKSAGKTGAQDFSAAQVSGEMRGKSLSRMAGKGNAVLRAGVPGAGGRTVTAGLITGEFDSAGDLKLLSAEDHTTLVLDEQAAKRTMRGAKLEARMASGQMTWFRQGPDFLLEEQDVRVSGEEATYEDGIMTVSGRRTLPRLVRPDSTTTAQRLMVFEKDGRLIARGDVRTEMRPTDQSRPLFPTFESTKPVLVRAEEAEIRREQVTFRGKVKAYQDADFLFADQATLQSDRLVAEGSVRTVVYRLSKGELRRLTVDAGKLSYEGKSQSASYSENVSLSGQDLSMTARTLDLRFGSDHRVQQGLARTGVTVRQAGRTATGDAAEYNFEADRIVLTGNLAQVVDPVRGRSRGRRLTFYLDSDKILVES